MGVPNIGEVWPRSHHDGSDNGEQTIIDRRLLGGGRFAAITVLSRGVRRWQTWTGDEKHDRDVGSIRSFRDLDEALMDWRSRG